MNKVETLFIGGPLDSEIRYIPAIMPIVRVAIARPLFTSWRPEGVDSNQMILPLDTMEYKIQRCAMMDPKTQPWEEPKLLMYFNVAYAPGWE